MAMNIAFVTTEFPPNIGGGAAISSNLIVKELRNKGIEVDVFSLDGEERAPVKVSNNHYRIPREYLSKRIPGMVGKSVTSYRHLPKFHNYDVVHNYGPGHLPGTVLKSNTPIIATFNNSRWVCINSRKFLKDGCPPYGFRQAYSNARDSGYSRSGSFAAASIEYIGKSIVNKANLITVQTKGMRNILNKCGYDKSKIKVIPNISDPNFNQSSRSCPPGDSRKLIFVGRLVDQKGPLELLRAFTSISKDKYEDWQLSLYGSGKLENKVEIEFVNRYSQISIEYAPYEDLANKAYNDAAAVIHPSKWPEPFSRVWLEAMSTGTPIICSNNPSSRCVLGEHVDLFDPFEEVDIITALEKLMENNQYRNKQGKLLKNLENLYLPSKIVSQYVDAYRRLVY